MCLKTDERALHTDRNCHTDNTSCRTFFAGDSLFPVCRTSHHDNRRDDQVNLDIATELDDVPQADEPTMETVPERVRFLDLHG